MRRHLWVCFAVSALALLACGNPRPAAGEPDGSTPVPEPLPPVPVTTLTPGPGPFNDRLTVQVTTDREATVTVTLDGSDPLMPGGARMEGVAPFSVDLTRTTTLRYFARTAEGGVETPRSGEFVRAGGPKGVISGVVQVGLPGANQALTLLVDGRPSPLPKAPAPGPVPFRLEQQTSGTHRLVAMADRDGNGVFNPLLDLVSEVVSVTLDVEDPFKASAENVALYLGDSAPDKATLRGVVMLPVSAAGQSLSVVAVNPAQLGGDVDAAKLLELLRSGDRMLTRADQAKYLYALTDLAPGRYTSVPVLGGVGTTGAAMNLIANPLRTVTLKAGDDATLDHTFGPVRLSGTLTVTRAPGAALFGYAVVVAKGFSFSNGIQAVLMTAPLTPVPGTDTQRGDYAGLGLIANQPFQLRAFTSAASANPVTDALLWALTPFGGAPPHGTIHTGSGDIRYDLIVK